MPIRTQKSSNCSGSAVMSSGYTVPYRFVCYNMVNIIGWLIDPGLKIMRREEINP
jgi:hypothetical protein